MSYLAKELNLKINLNTEHASTWHKYHSITQSIVNQSDAQRDYLLIPAINLLQYQVAVYGVYIERLMNARWKPTPQNIDGEEAVLKLIMSFFYEWCEKEVTSKRDHKVPLRELESKYIPDKTHDNMNVMYKGSIEYARFIFVTSDKEEFVPALHSNQSSIENHFSCIRGMTLV